MCRVRISGGLVDAEYARDCSGSDIKGFREEGQESAGGQDRDRGTGEVLRVASDDGFGLNPPGFSPEDGIQHDV